VSLTVAFAALATGIVVWFIIVRRLTTRSWEVQGVGPDVPGSPTRLGSAKVGLYGFLAVVTSLFALFLSAYYMRMGYGHGADAPAPTDWNAIRDPGVLWINTALLVLASIAMQWTRTAAARGEMPRTAAGLLVAGALTVGFLSGQVIAWRALDGSGYFTPSNPAAAFFVLLTAVHGLHLIGGLFVWLRTAVRLRTRRTELIDVLRSIELCAVYWHYLLLVWLVLFAVLLAT